MEKLLALQKLELDTTPPTQEYEAQIVRLREHVPASILDHFDWLIARGRKGVALARSGVCGECHLRLPSGTIAALAYTNEIHLCDNCGRYLYLPENEPLGLSVSLPIKGPSKSRPNRARQIADLHVA